MVWIFRRNSRGNDMPLLSDLSMLFLNFENVTLPLVLFEGWS